MTSNKVWNLPLLLATLAVAILVIVFKPEWTRVAILTAALFGMLLWQFRNLWTTFWFWKIVSFLLGVHVLLMILLKSFMDSLRFLLMLPLGIVEGILIIIIVIRMAELRAPGRLEDIAPDR